MKGIYTLTSHRISLKEFEDSGLTLKGPVY